MKKFLITIALFLSLIGSSLASDDTTAPSCPRVEALRSIDGWLVFWPESYIDFGSFSKIFERVILYITDSGQVIVLRMEEKKDE